MTFREVPSRSRSESYSYSCPCEFSRARALSLAGPRGLAAADREALERTLGRVLGVLAVLLAMVGLVSCDGSGSNVADGSGAVGGDSEVPLDPPADPPEDPPEEPPLPIDEDPVAVVSVDVPSGGAPFAVQASAAGSVDADGDIVSYLWDFGDGSADEEGISVEHVYSFVGSYTVELRVVDSRGGSDLATSSVEVTEPECPSFLAGVNQGNVESNSIVEASGLAASRKNPGVIWVHNDSGDSARVFAMSLDGGHIGTYTISGASAQDWEDMAVGPGPDGTGDCLWIGDTGDNAKARSHVVVYRVQEPTVDPLAGPITASLSGAARMELAYPDGPWDCECLLVDPGTRDLYLVSKRSDGRSGVYRAAWPQSTTSRTTMSLVASLAFGTAPLGGSTLVTAGDISPLGNWIILRTYSHVHVWRRSHASLASAFEGDPCVAPVRSEAQGEAVAFAGDGLGYYTVSEGSHPAFYYYALEVDS